MVRILKILNLLILGILIAMNVIGIFQDIFYGWDLGVKISYLTLFATMITHLTLTIISRKKGSKRFMILSFVFFLLAIHFYLKSTLWRCSEYSYKGSYFYLPCRFEKNPCSLSREVLIDIHKLDSITNIPEIKRRDREWMRNNYNEPSLLDAKNETYRLIWSSSFDGSEVIRVEKIKNSYYVTKKVFSSHSDTLGVTSNFQIEQKVWNNIVESLKILNFWTYKTSIDRRGLDGSGWTLEGYKPQKDECTRKHYHQVGRWSPIDSTFISMCRLLRDLEK